VFTFSVESCLDNFVVQESVDKLDNSTLAIQVNTYTIMTFVAPVHQIGNVSGVSQTLVSDMTPTHITFNYLHLLKLLMAPKCECRDRCR